MANILLLANGTYGARLKSDLEYIGHSVNHLIIINQSEFTPRPDGSISDPPDLIIIAPEESLDKLTQALNHLNQNPKIAKKPLLVFTDETTALDLDFSLGIDDFIVKPYSLREIEARLRLVLWRDNYTNNQHTLKIENLVINTAKYEVRVKGNLVELTLKEYELLKHLVTHQGRVFTRADLLDSIWGYDYYGGMRTVDVHIRRLRSKLGDIGETIATIRGVGYKFDPL